MEHYHSFTSLETICYLKVSEFLKSFPDTNANFEGVQMWFMVWKRCILNICGTFVARHRLPSISGRFRVVKCLCLVYNDYSGCYEGKLVILHRRVNHLKTFKAFSKMVAQKPRKISLKDSRKRSTV